MAEADGEVTKIDIREDSDQAAGANSISRASMNPSPDKTGIWHGKISRRKDQEGRGEGIEQFTFYTGPEFKTTVQEEPGVQSSFETVLVPQEGRPAEREFAVTPPGKLRYTKETAALMPDEWKQTPGWKLIPGWSPLIERIKTEPREQPMTDEEIEADSRRHRDTMAQEYIDMENRRRAKPLDPKEIRFKREVQELRDLPLLSVVATLKNDIEISAVARGLAVPIEINEARKEAIDTQAEDPERTSIDTPPARLIIAPVDETHIVKKRYQQELRNYRKVLDELHDEVTSPEAEMKLREIAARYQNTAELPLPDFLRTVRARLNRTLVFDFDDTISDFKYYRPGQVDPLLLGSNVIDPRMMENPDLLVPFMACLWQPLAASYPDIFAKGGEEVPFRLDMKELLEAALEQGISVKIISTNFKPFLEAAMKRIKGGDNIELFCIQDQDARSTQKGDLLKKIALENPDSVIEYIGDGSTDFPVVEAANIIPGIHAVRDAGFDKKLTESGILHSTFEDGFELGEFLGIRFRKLQRMR